MALQHLGADAYGAWSAALALTAFTAFADLGLGVGLMTRLAATVAKPDYERAQVMVSTVYVAVGTIVTLLLSSLWISTLWVDWGAIVGGKDAEINCVVLATLSVFLVNVLAGLIVRVQYAVQEVAYSNLWQASGSLIGIGGVAVAVTLGTAPPVFILMASGTPTLIGLTNAFWFFFCGRGRRFRPTPRMFNLAEAKVLFGLGLRFLLITVLLSVSMSMDPLIVAKAVGLDAVPEYAITARLFGMMSVVVGALSIPLWTANVRALHSNNFEWVEKMTRRMIVISALSVGVLSAMLVLLAPSFMEVWLGGSIAPSSTLLLGMATVSLLQAVVAPLFMVQNAAEVLRPQTIGYSLLLLSLLVKWHVIGAVGADFVPWVTVVSYSVVILPAAIIGYRKSVTREPCFGGRK